MMFKVKNNKPLFVAFGVIGFLVLANMIVSNLLPPMVKNFSSSEKRGFYRVYPNSDINKGDLVLIDIKDKILGFRKHLSWLKGDIPFLKRVAALGGDFVCHADKVLFINGEAFVPIFERDSSGHKINGKRGCYKIADGEFLAINTYSQNSFDSRYFGPLLVNSIIGRTEAIFTF